MIEQWQLTNMKAAAQKLRNAMAVSDTFIAVYDFPRAHGYLKGTAIGVAIELESAIETYEAEIAAASGRPTVTYPPSFLAAITDELMGNAA